jgi:hypothetical protein
MKTNSCLYITACRSKSDRLLDLVNCRQKILSNGVTMLESSVLFGVIKRILTENLLSIMQLTNYYRHPYE